MTWIDLQDSEKLSILADIKEQTGFHLFIIEKDWWVVQALRLVSQMDIANQIAFKGGTSLSKAWGIIDRFSEDVDLSINREFFGFSGDISRTQVGKMKSISNKYISNDFLQTLQKAFDNAGIKDVQLSVVDQRDADDDPVKIEIAYPTVINYTDYVKPRVLLEIGSRSSMEPSTVRSFRSMIGEYFPDSQFADEYLQIRCINPERTVLEKLFLLHEEHQRPVEKIKIEGRSRHFYDICQIAKTPFLDKAIADKELFKSIVAHREHFTKLSGVDYTSHFPPNLNPIPQAEMYEKWKDDYELVREQMVVGDTPKFEELIDEIKRLTERINNEKI
jgi:hypothetical protein